MAAIDDLLLRVEDKALRERLQQEFNKLNKQKKFGLVFEEHLPECTPLYEIPVKKGTLVSLKGKDIRNIYSVASIDGDTAKCVNRDTKEIEEFPLGALVPVAQFGDPIYPQLVKIDSVQNAPESDLWHTLIQADNYHALQLLEYLYAGKVDCIYIDPPYNTGAKDWKYNNDYVDSTDSYRHSKWLSMMQKRLKIAKRLLNPENSVLIVTIDEKEYLHLGCLLEEMFADANIQMITSVISSQGSTRDGLFSRADEYLFFVFIGNATVAKSSDDMLNEGQSATKCQFWFQFVRTGKGNLRVDSKSLFYPIFANKDGKIVSIGDSIPLNIDKSTVQAPDGLFPIWPMTADGREARWRTGIEVAKRRLSKGLLRLGKTSKKENGWSVLTVNEGTEKRIENGEIEIARYDENGSAVLVERRGGSLRAPKTVWNKVLHNAGWHGSKLLANILLDRKFPYPKSLYAVKDALNIVVQKANALIVDFFAGSGTTLHAVNLLNAEDGGSRRCIMVTNNEVSVDEVKDLTDKGLRPGDEEWEKLGIAQYVTWPRTVCSIKGRDIKGNPLKGNYIGSDIPMAQGFKANCVFFKLGFLDKNAVALGKQFKELLPILWMKSGCFGVCPELSDDGIPDMMILPENKFAVLNKESAYLQFEEQVNTHSEIETVYIITDSESGYREIIKHLNVKNKYQLYRDYLDNFRINARRDLR